MLRRNIVSGKKGMGQQPLHCSAAATMALRYRRKHQRRDDMKLLPSAHAPLARSP